jgi:hypothetical protein
MRDPMAFLYDASEREREACRVFGLSCPDTFPHGEWVSLGTSRDGITVECMAYPARFFRFTHDGLDGRRVIETGSGDLRDYYNAANLIASGMLKVTLTAAPRGTEARDDA